MANTNFAALTSEQLTIWSRDFWRVARNMSFINQFAGSGSNAMVQRISELTQSEKGARAVLTLLADMTGDGIVGDNTLEGNEEALRAYDIVVQLDQLRFANRLSGRLADQKSVVNFREHSRDALAYAMADRIDQLAFLSLSGVAYTQKNTGALRSVMTSGQNLGDLAFSGDVSAPTSNRHRRWDATSGLVAGDVTAVAAADTISYKSLVDLKAYAKDQYMRGIRSAGNDEMFHLFVTPQVMADLKLDSDFLANVRNAGVRGPGNSLFAGSSSLMVDGIMVHEFRHVFNTSGATTGTSSNAGSAGYKWGADADINGSACLFCGAQALAMADIGIPEIVEDTFDYGNQNGISIGKIFGLKKPVFNSDHSGQNEDFGVIRLDVAY
ncbi:MAG: putative major capsid protein [Prokaryotic dsDNA virus sp.]|nr:MAG: putative major capsid protein [Prokaryotic dsDNA virus sp.]|tara:strand:- start:17502 stop:18647 length:1146 start_codon:yes stop_codon:yes gene_type:complete